MSKFVKKLNNFITLILRGVSNAPVKCTFYER